MVEKKITRKVISPAKKGRPLEDKTTLISVQETEETVEQTAESEKTFRSKKACFFCQSKTQPSYTDINSLRRFVTDRAKIVPKAKSGLCSKHQRIVTKQIKYARHLSLLAFTPKM